MTDANREYQRIQKECRAALARLSGVLDGHAGRRAARPEYWTFVGDLKRARFDLLTVAANLGDEEAREILHAEGDSR